jgi:DNA processing protein
MGDPTLAQKRTVALVGARDASAAGLHMAQLLAQDLAAAGVVVVSGLARGVDTRAHQASLKTGTIAVLGGGLDQPYPPENATLHDAIAADGLLVTDAPLGYAPRAKDFPRRNAIIAGLSEAVVVVEASARSGALMTAHAAVELGRDAMAVPGSPLEPRARGGNQLIREGAALIESAEDVLAVLGGPRRLALSAPVAPQLDAPAESLVARVAQVLSPTPMHLNAIARAAGAPASAVAAALVELELTGQAMSESGGFATRPA